jgi:hypothetical protein
MARDSRPLELTVRPVLAGLTFLLLTGCGRTGGNGGFAGVQERGETAMGVDQYTSTHVFQPLPDGGRIVLQRDVPDANGTASIRDHMRHIAARFAEGDFRLPGFVHAQTVPGTDVMAARRSVITYAADTLPRGGEVRIRSTNPEAVRAIHAFLAFQRSDHRASAGGHAVHGGPR